MRRNAPNRVELPPHSTLHTTGSVGAPLVTGVRHGVDRREYGCKTAIVLEELHRLVDSLEFEECGKVVLTRCETGAADLTFTIAIQFDAADESLSPSSWTVRCAGYRRFRLEERVASDVSLVDDHVVIAACDEKRYDLYFTGGPVNRFDAVGRLTAAHRAAAQEWIRLSEFLNPASGPGEIFETAGGLIARAPHRVVHRYHDALREGGIDVYLANEKDPTRWDGAEWVPESELLTAFIFGNNYVVAERFLVSRAP